MLSHEEQFPIDPDAEEELHQFTFRAVFVGCVLGGVIAASNVYLGLKTGWTFGASLFGSIFGFAILKPMSRALPTYLGGGYFGPKENVCCQSAATAAGSLGLIFTSGLPAAYQLGLLDNPKADFGKLCTLTLACAYYGMFFAIPLRKLYILKQKLAFPSAVAAAYTIRSLHTGKNAEANAKKKTYALVIAFSLAITYRCVSEYAPGILWDWHWGWTLYSIGWKQAIKVENWSWIVEFTPAFIGVGFIAGVNASYSFFGGAIVAWGIIGPALVAAGEAFGTPIDPVKYPGYINYMGMVLDDPVNRPSPRYWLVWPGTMLLLAGSFAELAANWKAILGSFAALVEPLTNRFRKGRGGMYDQDQIEEPCPPSELVPTWMWGGGIILSIVFTCIIMGVQWGQNVGVTILAIFFAFLFSFIGVESAGRTNIIPVTSIGNAVQLIVGGTTHGHGTIANQQTLNITGGLLALGASEQSADMVGDLKTTHLLRASPRVQFYAQCCGAIVSVFMSVAMYVLFSEAYPCINDLALADNCAFAIPDVGAFRAIAVAVTSTSLPVPRSSGILCIVLLVWAFVQTYLKYKFVPVKYHHYVPNLVGMGIAFILNTTTYPAAMAFGATFAFFWRKNYPAAFGMYCYAVAAGMIAGEGLGGIVGAVLQVAKVSGNYYGTAIGCPAMAYCG
ncbi:hypothetical protein BAUCODRAFT_80544 [Baudoinia panamericana UAMH 10762]|uniref:OPT superfamily oligopeptide transporter n=1 Tax=Baudoinia panamericana (strain UAMH 10762) TaxID=717646 RepID=M2MYL5_BAUPA|nr:uncharacterized protein BAUCODRAFT_80544 [Baudoinia panamericana UAMH 10762]EMC91390.1 hypothetical protein BAUCODRAFT_80544 [Baudoinia panamericana UAMH 10762]